MHSALRHADCEARITIHHPQRFNLSLRFLADRHRLREYGPLSACAWSFLPYQETFFFSRIRSFVGCSVSRAVNLNGRDNGWSAELLPHVSFLPIHSLYLSRNVCRSTDHFFRRICITYIGSPKILHHFDHIITITTISRPSWSILNLIPMNNIDYCNSLSNKYQ